MANSALKQQIIRSQMDTVALGSRLDIGAYQKFFKKIVNGSFLLFGATLLAFLWANAFPTSYQFAWHTDISFHIGQIHITKSILHWIDEALMAVFFFTVGLEIKREILVGELASMKKALLPVAAAIGGMIVPALIYAAFNYGTPAARGWGIPMATDIAFSLAVLAILGRKIPFGIKVFLSAFAIADDLGAVIVIALFYTQTIVWSYLLLSLLFLAGLMIANLMWVRSTLVYALLGIGMWMAILGSGVHATVAGVLVAMFIPARGKYDTTTYLEKVKCYLNRFECSGECGYTILLNKEHLEACHNIEIACHELQTPLQRIEFTLHPWVAYLILPLFALANAGILLEGINFSQTILHPVTVGIFLGLVVGKPAGILLFTFLAVKVMKTPLLKGITWRHLTGASILGGIGFTMSLFIAGLSFSSQGLAELSKIGILSASLVSGVLGLALLGFNNREK